MQITLTTQPNRDIRTTTEHAGSTIVRTVEAAIPQEHGSEWRPALKWTYSRDAALSVHYRDLFGEDLEGVYVLASTGNWREGKDYVERPVPDPTAIRPNSNGEFRGVCMILRYTGGRMVFLGGEATTISLLSPVQIGH